MAEFSSSNSRKVESYYSGKKRKRNETGGTDEIPVRKIMFVWKQIWNGISRWQTRHICKFLISLLEVKCFHRSITSEVQSCSCCRDLKSARTDFAFCVFNYSHDQQGYQTILLQKKPSSKCHLKARWLGKCEKSTGLQNCSPE